MTDAESVAERFDVSRESFRRLTILADLLLQWQERMNLIGPATVPDLWTRHIADSLQVVPLLPPGAKRLVDLGSGAGFPGLVIAIVTDLDVHLIESTAKKATFLREAARVTGASATIHAARIETVAGTIAADVVTARALAPLPALLVLAEPWLGRGATGLFHKGRDVDAELTEAAESWRFKAIKHPSRITGGGVILELKDMARA